MDIMFIMAIFERLYMKAIAARDAKNNFGELLDTVQREPLTIKKHGRAVAVVMSAQEYQQMELERLQAKLGAGEEQLDKGEGVDGEAFFAELTVR